VEEEGEEQRRRKRENRSSRNPQHETVSCTNVGAFVGFNEKLKRDENIE